MKTAKTICLLSLLLFAPSLARSATYTDYFWNQNAGSAIWDSPSLWDTGETPNRAGISVYFTRDQADPASIYLGTGFTTYTIGHLTIGSENASTSYTLLGGNLIFDNNGAPSILTRHANGQLGDAISSNLILNANDLEIRSLSPNRFTLNGTISGSKNLTITGSGNLTIGSNNTTATSGIDAAIAVQNFNITNTDITHAFTGPSVNSIGIYVGTGNTLKVSGGNFINTINKGYGLRAENGGNITLNGISTFNNTASISSTAISANNTASIVNIGNITTFDTQSLLGGISVLANNNSSINLNKITNLTASTTFGGGYLFRSLNNSNLSFSDITTFSLTLAAGTAFDATSGNISLSKITTLHNNVSQGTSLYSNGGNITLADIATFNNNINNGNGIYTIAAGNITLKNIGTLTNNVINGQGIYAENGNIIIDNSTVHNIGDTTPLTTAYSILVASTGTLTLQNNTKIDGTNRNIYNNGGTFILDNSTVDIAATTTSANAFNNNNGGSIILKGNSTFTTTASAGIALANNGYLTLNNSSNLIINSLLGTTTASFQQNEYQYKTTLNDNSTITLNNDSAITSMSVSGNLTLNHSSNIIANTNATGTGIFLGPGSYLTLNGNSTLNLQGSANATGLYNYGTTTLNNYSTLNVANATLYNTGAITAQATARLRLLERGQLIHNTGTITATAIDLSTGGNQLIAGTGTYNTPITGMKSTARLSPGDYTPASGASSIGTMTFNKTQNWDAFTYDWQLNTTANGTAGGNYDTINFNTALALNLNTAGDYHLNILAPSLDFSSLAIGQSRIWTLISTATTNQILNFDPALWNDGLFSNPNLAAQQLLGLGNARLSLQTNASNSSLQLLLEILADYYWRENTNGLWSQGTTVWESNPTFNAISGNILLTRNQTASTGNITIDQATATIGNLTIGSDTGHHILSNNTINFNAGTGNTSTITHLANAQTGDTINSNITLNTNDLAIRALSQNALALNGTITGSKNLTISGSGNLTLNTNPTLGTNNASITVKNLEITGTNITQNHRGTESFAVGIHVGTGNTLAVSGGNYALNTIGGTPVYIDAGGSATFQNLANLTINASSIAYSLYATGTSSTLNLTDIANLKIDANNAYGITSGNNATVTLDRVANITAASPSTAYFFWATQNGALSINNTQTLSQTINNGYGFYAYDYGTLTINNTTADLINNVNGGVGIMAQSNSLISINNTATLTSNANAAGAYGIMAWVANLTINNTATFYNNVSAGYGINADSYGNITLSNIGTLTNNVTSGSGIHAAYNGNIIIDNSTIHNTGTPGVNAIRTDAGGRITLQNNTKMDSADTAIINIGTFTLNNSSLSLTHTASACATNSTFYNDTGATLTLNGNSTLDGSTLGGNTVISNNGTITLNDSSKLTATITPQYYAHHAIRNLSPSAQIILNHNSTLSIITHDDGSGISNSGSITLNNSANLILNATGTNSGALVNSFSTSALTLNNNSTLSLEGSRTSYTFVNFGTTTLNGYSSLNIQNASLSNRENALITAQPTASIRLRERGQIYNQGTITATTIDLSTGGNQLISGNGSYNTRLTGMKATTRLSPGFYGFDDDSAYIGTMTFCKTQTWDAFTYDWQLNTTANGTAGTNYDTISITAGNSLNLNPAGAYTLNIIAPALDFSTLAIGDTRAWLLVVATAANQIVNFDPALWNNGLFTTPELAAQQLLGLSNARLSLQKDLFSSNIQLLLEILANYYWRENTSGLWSQGLAVWETNPTFNAPGGNILFTRNQSAGNGIVTIDQVTATIGNLIIGSDQGRHIISNNTINFNGNSSTSTITHKANAQAGDTINSNITLTTNDLEIRALSANTLALNGTITGSKNLTISGSGNLTLNTDTLKLATDHNINLPKITITGTTITHNHNTDGNGIYIGTGNSLLMTGGNFTSNATAGRALHTVGNLSFNDLATLTNNASNASIGISITTGGNLSVDNTSTFINKASFPGSIGIYNSGGNTTLNGISTFYNDSATSLATFYQVGGNTTIGNITTLTFNASTSNGIYSTNGNFTINKVATLNTDFSGLGTHGFHSSDTNFTFSNITDFSLKTSGGAYGLVVLGNTLLSNIANLTATSTTPATSIYISGAKGNLTIDNTNATFDNTILYNDSGTITIRNNANLTLNDDSTLNATNTSTANTITIDSTSNLTLNNNSNLTLNGIRTSTGLKNQGTITLNGGSTSTLNNTTVINTRAAAGNAILINGTSTLTLNNTTFTQDISTGTGIYNNNSTLTINAGSTFDSTTNSAVGIYNGGENARLYLTNSTINSTNTIGAAIFNNGTFTINSGSTLTNNVTSGIGIHNLAPTANLDITDSTLINNASAGGTGINNLGGNITLTNSTLINNGPGTAISNTGTIKLGENTRLIHNNGTLNSSTGTLQVTGNNVLIAGNSTITATLTGVGGKNGTALGAFTNTTFSPGAYDSATGTSSIGTLTLSGNQDWSKGFNIDWQMASTTQNIGYNDLLKINGTLTLDSTFANRDLIYIINLSSLNLTGTSTAPADGMYWTILQATNILNFNPALWNDSSDFVASAATLLSTLDLTGKGRFSITGNSTEIGIKFQEVTPFIWNSTLSGNWTLDSNWENNWAPGIDATDADVYLIRNQTSSTGNISLQNQTITIGDLTIGSENAAATATHYLVENGTLVFQHSSGTSDLLHSTNAQGDEISADIQMANDLAVTTSANHVLTLSGNITGTSSQFSVAGTGSLLLKNGTTTLGTGTLDILTPGAALFLDNATIKTTGMTTIVGGAMIGGHGTLDGNITFQHEAILNFRGRLGAKYNDRFTVTGTSTFQGNSTFINLANFQKIVSDDPANGTSRMITNQQNVLWVNSLALDASAKYSIDLYNTGEFHIQDWTVAKSDFGVYYALVLSSSDFLNFNAANWSINWTNGSPWDTEIWEIVKTDHNGLHGIWLHYKNPNRIPEPSTYAALAAALALIATFIIRRRRK